MLGFNLVPEPSEGRRIREMVSRTNYLWAGFKETPQQQSVALRQLSALFNGAVAKLGKDLKPVMEDLDLQPIKPVNEEPPLNGVSSRSQLFKQTAQKLVRGQLLRNSEIKRTVDEYCRQHAQRHQQQPTIVVDAEKPSSASGMMSVQPRYSHRPRTTPINQRFSRSLIIQRRERSKEEQFNVKGFNMGMMTAPMFQCRGITPSGSCKSRHHNTQNSLAADKHIELSSMEFTSNSRPLNPEYPLLHLDEPDIPRVSFIDQNRRQFAPAFGQRRNSAFSTTNTAYGKATKVEILKDKIRLLNCQFAIKVTRQQGYKKKVRNPRNLSSILV